MEAAKPACGCLLFIAVVPILLITALAVLGGTLLGGQLSVHLVTAELDRRVASLRSSLEFLARRDELQSDWQKTFGPFQQSRFPGIQIAVTNGHRSVFPAESELSSPPLGDKDSSGLLLKNRLLYGWAQAVHKDRKVTAIFPITREYLGVLYPDLADTGVVHITDGRPNVLHLTPPDWKEPSRNRLPPQANFFDREIWWGVVLPVTIWENPGLADQNVFLHVRTRPSAVLRIVLAQKVDFAYDLILILFFGVAILFLIAEIIALAIGISLTRSITGAVHDLYEGTARVTGGDFSHRIPIQGKDQLGELSLAFNGMTGNMQRLLEGEKERERLQAELEIAREVQNQLYPRHVPDFPSLCLTAVCNPARMVSGDYYDYQLIEKDKVAIVMGDVAGKGISAALLMATVQSSFRTQLRVSLEVFTPVNQVAKMTVSTSKVVSCLNQQLFADTAPEKYATFYLGVYDALTSELTYTNAGHLPPI
ncbi:MAG: SpoIIE family protein phosphatase [Bryobacteraceae bacterium]